MPRAMKSARVLIGVNLAVYAAFGLAALFVPRWLASVVGIELSSPSALADFRAIYGGIPLGIGVAMAAGLYRSEWLIPAVALAGVCALEAALARAYSWIASGTPSALIIAFMCAELLAAHWAWSCYRRLDPRTKSWGQAHEGHESSALS
jgi:hypothetical protein